VTLLLISRSVSWMDVELHLVMTISAVHHRCFIKSSSSTSVQLAARLAGCIRRIALMRLQITRYYFSYKETNQIIMSFEFGLRWHPAESVSCMLLHRLSFAAFLLKWLHHVLVHKRTIYLKCIKSRDPSNKKYWNKRWMVALQHSSMRKSLLWLWRNIL